MKPTIEAGYHTGYTTTVNPATGKPFKWIRFGPGLREDQCQTWNGREWRTVSIGSGSARIRVSWTDERSIEGRCYSPDEIAAGMPRREAIDWIKRGIIQLLKFKLLTK